MYYVYILRSFVDHSLYVGFTRNVVKRVRAHNEGLNHSTVRFKPWALIYCEAYVVKEDALGREKFLKSGSGKKYLDKQLKNYFQKNPRKRLWGLRSSLFI